MRANGWYAVEVLSGLGVWGALVARNAGLAALAVLRGSDAAVRDMERG